VVLQNGSARQLTPRELDLLRKSGEFPMSYEELDDTAARFTKEFAEEAVRLVQTSGRTQREIASDLGIGRSTLVRWIGRSRDRRAVDPAAAESEITAELKRLRRENEVLRQERDILKKATAFFAREGSR
jgi:transposase